MAGEWGLRVWQVSGVEGVVGEWGLRVWQVSGVEGVLA